METATWMIVQLKYFYIYVYFETLLFIALTRWQLWKQCSWKRWMIRISAWTWRRWGRDGAACKPPSPTGRGFRRARPRGRKEAGNSLAVRSRSCWRRGPCGSLAWYRKAPWSWWSSYSKWIWGSGVYCLYFPLFDPQVHGDCGEKITGRKELEIWTVTSVWDGFTTETAVLTVSGESSIFLFVFSHSNNFKGLIQLFVVLFIFFLSVRAEHHHI